METGPEASLGMTTAVEGVPAGVADVADETVVLTIRIPTHGEMVPGEVIVKVAGPTSGAGLTVDGLPRSLSDLELIQEFDSLNAWPHALFP